MANYNEPTQYTKDVFISYSTIDSTEISDFVALLKNSGINFFLDKIDIGWGESISERVFSGIETSRYVVVFISRNSLNSTWVKNEINAAFQREIESKFITLLPILCCPQDEFFAEFPFLQSKKYLRFEDKGQIIQNLIELLRGKANTNFTFNHPHSYHGLVWIRLLATSENHNSQHNVTIRWGPWYRECPVQLSDKEPLFLTHSKGNDAESLPIRIRIDKPAHVAIGQGIPNSVNCNDINAFWIDAKSRIKRIIAKTFLWP